MFAKDKKAGKDDDFDVVAQYDRQGNLIKKRDKLLEKFYDIDEDDKKPKVKKNRDASSSSSDDEEAVDGGKDVKTKFYDEEGNFQWQGADSSSSDEEGAAEEGEHEQMAMEEGEDEMEELDAAWDEENDIPHGDLVKEEEAGSRLALYKMDWDITSAVDILSIFSSLCRSGEHLVTKVEIYPSLLGLERMK